MSLAALVSTASGCAAETDGDDDGEVATEALSTVALGVDTNGSTLDVNYMRSQGFSFVARYLSFDGSHPALTPEEANRFRAAKVPLVAIWETGQQRAVQTGSIKGQHVAGVADAQQANARLIAVGAGGKPIYFTVDFNVTPQYWNQKVKDTQTKQTITRGDLILSYFEGINAVIGSKRSGAYGTHTTIKSLFDAGKIGYGWQQTFASRGDVVDPRAQLRQYDIYPSQTGWGVAGAGALDLDRAVKRDFGQW